MFRLTAVAVSLGKLIDVVPTVGAAVYYTWVEPWDVYEPKRRLKLARLGVYLMALEIRGPIPAFDVKSRIAHWRRLGATYRQIAAREHVSMKTIAKLSGQSLDKNAQ